MHDVVRCVGVSRVTVDEFEEREFEQRIKSVEGGFVPFFEAHDKAVDFFLSIFIKNNRVLP